MSKLTREQIDRELRTLIKQLEELRLKMEALSGQFRALVFVGDGIGLHTVRLQMHATFDGQLDCHARFVQLQVELMDLDG